jgi:hypothetical protein
MFLIVDNEACYSLPTQWLFVGWDYFVSLDLLELKGLKEVNKYSCFSPSSVLVIKLVSVERMDSAIIFPLLTACSLFRLQLPFKCIKFFEKNKEGQRLLSRSSFGFKKSLFLLIKCNAYSAISRFVVVLVTIVTPHVGRLSILGRVAYITGKRFLLSTGSVARLRPLMSLISKFSKRLK